MRMKTFDIKTPHGHRIGSVTIGEDLDFIDANWNFGGIMWYWLRKRKDKESAEVWADIHLCNNCVHLDGTCKGTYWGGFPISKCDQFKWAEVKE